MKLNRTIFWTIPRTTVTELFEGESLNLVISEPVMVREETESGSVFEG